jgi:hypothetical protein
VRATASNAPPLAETAAPEQSSTTSSGGVKRKANAAPSQEDKPAAEPQTGEGKASGKATADSNEQQDKSKPKKKKNKYHSACNRCGNYHSGECWLKEKCAKCDTFHFSNQPCPVSDAEVEKWSGFLSDIANPDAARAAG